MATRRSSQRSLLRKDHMYDFCIKFLTITGIRLPSRRESLDSVDSTLNNCHSYCLKITLLHGTEQQNIGEFEVIGDECVINHQLSCQIAYGTSDKLHVYIDQNWSVGLSGHITVDLKEFCEDVDAEIYLEYPLFSSGPSHVQRTAKLEMSVLCSSTKKIAFLDHADSNQEFLHSEDLSNLRPSFDNLWYPPDPVDTERRHEAPSILLDSVLEQVSPTNACLDKIDREIEVLKEMEGQRARNMSTRPDVLVAVYFAAGMAFQRQVDRENRYRIYRGTEVPLLLGGSPSLLLEDVSPTSRSEASRNPEVDSFCQSSSRSLALSESSSNNCGHGQSCSEATTSLAGDIDEDESDRNYLDSVCLGDPDMPISHLEPELESARTVNNTSSPVDESSTSKEATNIGELENLKQPNSRLSKYNVLNVVGSVLSAFSMAGLSLNGSEDTHSRASGDDEEVTVSGSMLGRHQITSMQTIRKSNPGLGWLSDSNQFK